MLDRRSHSFPFHREMHCPTAPIEHSLELQYRFLHSISAFAVVTELVDREASVVAMSRNDKKLLAIRPRVLS
jgi:hypothetical protein